MTIHRNLNQAGNGGNHFHYYQKETLKAAGWKVLDSGVGEDSLGNSTPYRVPGTGDTITQDTPDVNHCQLDDVGGAFTAAMIGNYITISGATAPANNGMFEITAVNSGTQLVYDNANGVTVTEAFTYALHGDHFTSVLVGAADFFAGGTLNIPFNSPMGGGGCWYRVQDPAGNREILARRNALDASTYDAYWAMAYSKVAPFIGGAPSYDTAPTAIDEQVISNTGTIIAPTSLHGGGGLANLLHFAADDVPSAIGEYGFISLEFVTPNDLKCMVKLDDLQNTASGDTSPLTICHNNLDLSYAYLYNASYKMGLTWVDDGGGGEAWLSAEYLISQGNGGIYPTTGKVSKYDGKERPLLIPVSEPTVGGYLGISRWFHWTAVQRDYPNTGDSLNVLYVDDVAIVDLWDGVTSPQAI